MSFFITLEGPDGCGKTTQTGLLYKFLKKKGYKVIHTREPGGTGFAEILRKIILDPKNKVEPITELFLYAAARVEHTYKKIIPYLKKNYIVLCERYIDATKAYQGYARGIPLEIIDKVNEYATGGLKPELTILLLSNPKSTLKRIKTKDRLELEGIEFQKKIIEGYKKIAAEEKNRFYIIDATKSISEIHSEIKDVVMSKIKCLKKS
ncbi:MAG: dTMP kinase [bacterium]|nr:dTMP kinase [bacterium]